MPEPIQFSLFGDDEPQQTKNLLPKESHQAPIAYTLHRSRRRTIGLRLEPEGLIVSAPLWVSLEQIERFIESKRSWIEKKTAERAQWRSEAGLDEVRFETGGKIPYRGGHIALRVGGVAKTTLQEGVLSVALPENAETERVREAVLAWLVAEAEALIAARLPAMVQKAGVGPRRWRLSSAHKRWGSCSPDGSVRFSWTIVMFDDEVVDYLIAHELTHLKYMDHSERFWKALEAIMPTYVQAEAKLTHASVAGLPF